MSDYLPPGVTHSHPYFNPPDRSHEHEWELSTDSPIIEDGAAIFTEKCRYREGRYGEEWQCEEIRRYRFEYDSLETPSGIEYDLPEISEWDDNDDIPHKHKMKAITIGERFYSSYHSVEIDVDPDPDCGVVTLEYNGWKLKFRP